MLEAHVDGGPAVLESDLRSSLTWRVAYDYRKVCENEVVCWYHGWIHRFPSLGLLPPRHR